MDTASFRTLKPSELPRGLGLMMRVFPYCIALITLCVAVAFSLEAHAPRGTFAYITRSGISASALTWLAFLCGACGLCWHWARRSLFWSCVVCAVTLMPMVLYSYFGTLYLTTEVQGSYATLVIFWAFCAVSCFFVGFLILLAAWMEVSKLADRMRG